jgi:hypothetical protein
VAALPPLAGLCYDGPLSEVGRDRSRLEEPRQAQVGRRASTARNENVGWMCAGHQPIERSRRQNGGHQVDTNAFRDQPAFGGHRLIY